MEDEKQGSDKIKGIFLMMSQAAGEKTKEDALTWSY